MKKIITYILCFCICLSCLSVTHVMAAGDVYPYEVYCSNKNPAIGNTIALRVSLSDYKNASVKIRGLQIDITNVDSSVFEVVDHHTLIDQTSVASNMTSYSETNSRLRLVYANSDGTLSDNTTNVMEIKLKIKDSLTEEGSISLPLTIKIQTTEVGAAGRITQKSSIDINYKIKSEIFSADIQWGRMEFVYSDGTWNPSTHKCEKSGWMCDDEANIIKVSNGGDMDIKASYSYMSEDEFKNVLGKFTNSDNNEVTYNEITSGETSSVYLQLFGKPNEEIESQKIGSVKVIIDEVA